MAIPTDFKGPTPAANTTKSFKVMGSATVGLWALDIDGTLSAGTSRIELAPNMVLLFGQAYTDAAITAILKDYLGRMGVCRDSAGGSTPEISKQLAVTATTCT